MCTHAGTFCIACIAVELCSWLKTSTSTLDQRNFVSWRKKWHNPGELSPRWNGKVLRVYIYIYTHNFIYTHIFIIYIYVFIKCQWNAALRLLTQQSHQVVRVLHTWPGMRTKRPKLAQKLWNPNKWIHNSLRHPDLLVPLVRWRRPRLAVHVGSRMGNVVKQGKTLPRLNEQEAGMDDATLAHIHP